MVKERRISQLNQQVNDTIMFLEIHSKHMAVL